METAKQYGGPIVSGKEMFGRGWEITGEITTGRVIVRLNGTITGLIWPLIAATALRNDALCARAHAHAGVRMCIETDSLSGH